MAKPKTSDGQLAEPLFEGGSEQPSGLGARTTGESVPPFAHPAHPRGLVRPTGSARKRPTEVCRRSSSG